MSGEQPKKEFGEVGFLTRRGKKNVEEPVECFRKQAAVAGHAGFGKERDAVGFVQDGSDTREVAVANFFGGLKDGNPDAFAAPLGGREGRDKGFASRDGDAGVANAKPISEGDEGINAATARAGPGKHFDFLCKLLNRGIFLRCRREEREQQVSC